MFMCLILAEVPLLRSCQDSRQSADGAAKPPLGEQSGILLPGAPGAPGAPEGPGLAAVARPLVTVLLELLAELAPPKSCQASRQSSAGAAKPPPGEQLGILPVGRLGAPAGPGPAAAAAAAAAAGALALGVALRELLAELAKSCQASRRSSARVPPGAPLVGFGGVPPKSRQACRRSSAGAAKPPPGERSGIFPVGAPGAPKGPDLAAEARPLAGFGAEGSSCVAPAPRLWRAALPGEEASSELQNLKKHKAAVCNKHARPIIYTRN